MCLIAYWSFENKMAKDKINYDHNRKKKHQDPNHIQKYLFFKL